MRSEQKHWLALIASVVLVSVCSARVLQSGGHIQDPTAVLKQKGAEAINTISTKVTDAFVQRTSQALDKIANAPPVDVKSFIGSLDHVFKKAPQDINVIIPVPAASPQPQVMSLPTPNPSSLSVQGGGVQTITRTPTVIENPFNLVSPTKITEISWSKRMESLASKLSDLMGAWNGYTVPSPPAPSGPLG